MLDPGRFRRLAAAHWAEQRKPYAWFFGIGIIVHFVLMLIVLSGEFGYRLLDPDGQSLFYYTGLFLSAPIFAGRYFQAMARRESALIALMRPASIFEKWLLAFLVVALAYPLAYTLAFYVCDLPAWLLAKWQWQAALAQAQASGAVDAYATRYTPERFVLYFAFSGETPWRSLLAIGLMLTTLQAFAVLGSLYFRAMPFIKTLVAGFFILLLSILLAVLFDSRADVLFGYWTNERSLSPVQQVLLPLVWFAVPGLLWLACYFALQEREVA